MDASKPEPHPIPNSNPHIADWVMADVAAAGNVYLSQSLASQILTDLKARKKKGFESYGTALQAHNGRNALMDLYQEVTDGVQYARQVQEEGVTPAIQPIYANLFAMMIRVKQLLNEQEGSSAS